MSESLPCYWCGEPAEHMCADCECDLCEDCVLQGRCMGCQPLSDEEWDDLAPHFVRADLEAEEEIARLPWVDPVTGREVAA
ncbi:MAG: hypothetical protein OXN97_06580 [Bryobacterales bacterium]|nr:hypothetical protein [Bryobacterales bacterium]MDE0629513.1 hypothetical protein [Bryobacterales bacterium]